MPNINFVLVTTTLARIAAAPLNYLPIAGIPADTVPFAEAAKSYSSTTAMLDDGFISTDPAVLAAAQVFGQGDFTETPPTRVVVIAKGTYTAAVVDVQITDNDDGDYEIYIALLGGGEPVLAATFTASGNTITQIRDGLLAAWVATDQNETSQSTDKVRITAVVAGAPFTVTTVGPGATPFAAPVTITPNVGPYEEMTAAWQLEPFWAVLPDPGEADGLVLEWSRWAEASKERTSQRRNICIVQVVDSDIVDDVSPNTATIYEGLARSRTFLVVHVNTSDRMNAADFGLYGGGFPGSRAWHFRPLSGSSETVDIVYSYDEGVILQAAKVSWVERDVASTSSPLKVMYGMGSGGFFAEQKQAEDYWWLKTNAAVIAANESQAGVNIDDAGIAKVVAAITGVNIELAANGVIDLARTTITPVPAADVPASEAALGIYIPTGGGIEVETVLIPKLRQVEVGAVFNLA